MTNDFFQSMVLELELTRCVENRRMCLLTAVWNVHFMRTLTIVPRWSGVQTLILSLLGRHAEEGVLAGEELLPSLEIAAPAPDQAESFPRDTSPHLHPSNMHMSACVEPSVERLVRVNIPLCLCRWNVCMCVRSSVCSLVCLSVVVVEPTATQPAPLPLTARSHWHATWNI